MRNIKLTLLLSILFSNQLTLANENCSNVDIQERLNNGETPISIYESCGSQVSLLYGKSYAGGLIAYLNTTQGENYGHGFVAKPADELNGGILWVNLIKGYSWSDASATAIGTGKANTIKITNNLGAPDPSYFPGTYAAWLSKDPFNGYNDWYLPSRDELAQTITTVIKPSGSCSVDGYWSSSEYQPNPRTAYFLDCVGSNTYRIKNNGFSVRLIRNFGAEPTLTTASRSELAQIQFSARFTNLNKYTVRRQGFCIGSTKFPTMANFINGKSTSSDTYTYIIGFRESQQGDRAYARSCATISDGTTSLDIYGNQIQFTYPQVIQTLAASNIKAYSATLGGNITQPSLSSISSAGIKVYDATGSTLIGSTGLELTNGSAQGIFASKLQPNTTYKYQAIAAKRISSNPEKYYTYPGKMVTFTTSGPNMITNPPSVYMNILTKNELNRFSPPSGSDLWCKYEIINKQQTCNTLVYGDYTYLFLSETNNSWGTVVAKYQYNYKNKRYELLANKKFWGARYNHGISVNKTDQTVTMTGEGDSSITIQWSSLP